MAGNRLAMEAGLRGMEEGYYLSRLVQSRPTVKNPEKLLEEANVTVTESNTALPWTDSRCSRQSTVCVSSPPKDCRPKGPWQVPYRSCSQPESLGPQDQLQRFGHNVILVFTVKVNEEWAHILSVRSPVLALLQNVSEARSVPA